MSDIPKCREDMLRDQFEKWISGPPFEKSVVRLSESSAWPGMYRSYAVDLAWQAWKGSMECCDPYPVFDILERLYAKGYYHSQQDGQWWLWAKGGDGICSGQTFRDLCVNIVLMGL